MLDFLSSPSIGLVNGLPASPATPDHTLGLDGLRLSFPAAASSDSLRTCPARSWCRDCICE